MRRNVLLTGRPGVGKSTVIQRALELADVEAGGFFTQQLQEDGKRVGFGITTLDGERGILAHVDIQGQPRVSKYGVNVEDIRDVAVAALRRALEDAQVIVCDEIASMEMKCPQFEPAVREALESRKPLLGTIQQRSDPFLDEVRSRDDVTIVEVTRASRDALPQQIAAWIDEVAC
ncbi:MAG: NTPase [Armatimonadota bacterium]|nr:NTPase [Armatimonadota bacterium]